MIITENGDLFTTLKDYSIKRCFDNTKVDFSSSMKAPIRLGFNLYYGWSDEYTIPMDLMECLDNNNKKLARNVIQIQFDNCFYYGLLE